MISSHDTSILRELARRYAAYAALPVQAEKRALWEALNTGRMKRPLVLFDQLPWNELDVDGSLVCQVEDPWWRGVECELRRTLYKWEHLPADMVLTPYLLLPGFAGHTGFGLNIIEHTVATDPTSDVLARSFECQFNSMDDVKKIQTPHLVFDEKSMAQRADEANDLFNGIVEWRFSGVVMHLGAWDWISQWMGVTPVYMAFYDNPEMLHAMMERLTQGVLSVIDEMNDAKVFDLYSTYCHCSHTFRPGDSTVGENVNAKGLLGGTSSEAWAFGLAQLFSSVSPDITSEFEVPYMSRIFPKFRDIYYGCCDKLSDRMDRIAPLPNVRKVSCSPWSDPEPFAAGLPKDRVMSVKPNPAYFAAPTFRLDAIRADLASKVEIARRHGCLQEFIFKDVSTVKYQPQNLWDTAKMAVDLLSEQA